MASTASGKRFWSCVFFSVNSNSYIVSNIEGLDNIFLASIDEEYWVIIYFKTMKHK